MGFRMKAETLTEILDSVFFRRSFLKRNRNRPSRQSEGGQIVVEYVLLLVIAVTIAMLMTRLMVSRDPGQSGFVISKWNQIIEAIGADAADTPRQQQ